MEWLDSIPEAFRGFAVVGFVFAGAAYAIWSSRRGARESEPKMQEFAMAGQLADMGPVKQLVEGVGLLIQQQVRTNMHLEKAADALTRAAESYDAHLKAEQTQDEIEEKAQALFERRLAQDRDAPPEDRRRPPRRTE